MCNCNKPSFSLTELVSLKLRHFSLALDRKISYSSARKHTHKLNCCDKNNSCFLVNMIHLDTVWVYSCRYWLPDICYIDQQLKGHQIEQLRGAIPMVTWGYVELVADGEAPDLSTDAGRDALPPEFTHTPGVTPAS